MKNPYLFPAKNSYQVGSGVIIDVGINTEPISEGQFGQYPIYVYTSKGTWALEQGSGGVAFGSISPLNGDVIDAGTKVISIGVGCAYITGRGVYILSGKQSVRISSPIEGNIINTLVENKHYDYFLRNPALVDLADSLSDRNFLDYIDNAIMGFDKVNNELWICNKSFEWSYVYNFESSSWHKVSRTYTIFINNYPSLLGCDNQGVWDISDEIGTTEVSILITTQPLSLTLNEVYKKLNRSVMRCLVSTKLGTSITYAIFATDDLVTYQFLTGGQRTGSNIQNILTTRSHGSFKYYVFMICGILY